MNIPPDVRQLAESGRRREAAEYAGGGEFRQKTPSLKPSGVISIKY